MNLQRNFKRTAIAASFVVLGVGLSGQAGAVLFSFTGNSGTNGQALSATANFQVSGTSLTVILTNTASAAANDGANVLDGLYFDIAGSPIFSNGNATLTSGSNLVKKNDNANHAGNSLNNEWMFKTPVSNTSVLPNWTSGYGIGCTGFPNFNTNQNSFDKVFHAGSGTAGANDDYGIVPTAGITAGNGGNLYARNSMTFTFNLSSTFSESDITGVRVSYGSGGQTVLTSVPEPASMAAISVGLLGLIRKKRRS